MPARYTANISFLDKAETVSVVQIYASLVDTADFVTDPTANPITDVANAIAALSYGAKTQIRAGREELFVPVVTPTDDQAYNSSKLIVYFQDDVTAEKYTLTIPARNPAKYNTYPGSKDVIMTLAAGGTAEIDAFITQFETKALSKDGNAVSITKIQIAGRKQGG